MEDGSSEAAVGFPSRPTNNKDDDGIEGRDYDVGRHQSLRPAFELVRL